MKKLKKYMPRVIAGILCLLMVGSIVVAAAYTAGAEGVASVKKSDSDKSEAAQDGELSKEETVYVIAKADGTPEKIIVSDWIKNPAKLDTIEDKTDLDGIKNVKGDEEFTIDENKMCVWDAEGNDIYYQGSSKEALPVNLSVSYKLDGKSVTPKELEGKNGKVTVRYEYTNNQYEDVKINGKTRRIYVPFVMLTGMILDNESVRNVTVSSGKVINDGSHTIVAGFAIPGMNENLNLKTDEFEIPDYVEITADVTDFEPGTTITVAANDMFSDIDFSKADKKIDELEDKLNELVDGVGQLADGSSQLYDGLATLADKSDELVAGVNKLVDGSKQISDGAASLSDGAEELDAGMTALLKGITDLDAGGTKLYKGVKKLNKGVVSLHSGAKTLDNGAQSLDSGAGDLEAGVLELAAGLGTLSENSETLRTGAKDVFNSLLNTATTQLTASGLEVEKLTIENYADVLDGVEKSLDKDAVYKLAYDTAYDTVTKTVRAQEALVKGQVEAVVRQTVLANVLQNAGLGMTVEQYSAAAESGQIDEATQTQINGAVDQQMETESIKATVTAQTETQIKNLIDTTMETEDVLNQIQAAVDKASDGAASVAALKGQLDSFNTFYQGILSYTGGVDSAKSGADQISGGTSTLKEGTGKLAGGTTDLKKGTKALKKGSKDLLTGTKTLKKGITKLKNGSSKLEKGTSKLFKGTETLSDGALTLYSGISTLRKGSGALVDGVDLLKNGSYKLKNGIQKLKDDGVSKLTDFVNGDAKELVERLKAISKVSSHYKSYGGISDDMEGKVNFIYKTATE